MRRVGGRKSAPSSRTLKVSIAGMITREEKLFMTDSVTASLWTFEIRHKGLLG